MTYSHLKHPIPRIVPGYSIGLETLMIAIRDGRTETPAFQYMLAHNKLSEEQAWDVFQAWSELRLHPLVSEITKRLFGT